MKSVLFVCSANRDRSKTAEEIFRKEYEHLTFSSAGTNKKFCEKYDTHYLTESDLIQSDLILCMTKENHTNPINTYTNNKYSEKIITLDIPDTYRYMSGDLIEILQEKVRPILHSL